MVERCVEIPLADLTIVRPGEAPPSEGWAIRPKDWELYYRLVARVEGLETESNTSAGDQ